MATRIVQEKRCPGCGITKPAADFSKHHTQPDGLASRCKECTKAKYRETYQLKAAKPFPAIEGEEWREIPGYETYYSASSFGRIRREAVKGSTHPTRHLIKPRMNRYGYFDVLLCRNGIPSHFTVHTLVAMAFYGVRPGGLVVNHKDGVKTNNHSSNLEYCTNDENMRHASEHGLMSSGAKHSALTLASTPKGEQCYMSKLTESQVVEIRQKHKLGRSLHSLSREYHLSRPAIKAVVARVTWKHI
jgi:hypothetical protein